MRMRRKPWARPELAAWDYYIDVPSQYMGRWQEAFATKQPLHLELGCGKGGFIANLAPKNTHINYIVVDIKSEVLALAKRNIEQSYGECMQDISNIALMSHDIERIDMMLSNSDKVDRIYVNFCNPWDIKEKHCKHRLTHTRQLMKYREFLSVVGEIHFKTDSLALFNDSLEYLKQSNFTISYLTYDLHCSDYQHNIVTEHEQMFADKGIKINFCIARMW